MLCQPGCVMAVSMQSMRSGMLLRRLLVWHRPYQSAFYSRGVPCSPNMSKRKPAEAASAEGKLQNGDASSLPYAPEEGANTTVDPQPKKRKPTKKQIEEAEAAARPVYTEALRPPRCNSPALRVVSWNVASLNSTLNKDPEAISRLAEKEDADVICLQETKLQCKATEEFEGKLNLGSGWHYHWACSDSRKGYSGTATICKSKPLSVKYGMGKAAAHDEEGRVITVEFESCYLVNVYTPNAGEGLKRLQYRVEEWDPAFAEFIGDLQRSKPVVITGDLNCAPRNIDIHSPWTNKKSPGFTEEERESFSKNLAACKLVDCFRHQFPNHGGGYTYWSIRSAARAKNKGWRLDLFLCSESLMENVYDCFILKSYQEEAKLSDHCPVGLVLKL